jgi:hypothetical protein
LDFYSNCPSEHLIWKRFKKNGRDDPGVGGSG